MLREMSGAICQLTLSMLWNNKTHPGWLERLQVLLGVLPETCPIGLLGL